VGSDIDPKCKDLKFKSKRVKLVIGDINKIVTRNKITTLAKGFDIIIDDGSHKSEDINGTFIFFYPHLNPGGIYLIEDLHCSYWKRYGGGLLENQSSIAFLKLFIDILNFESWGMAFKKFSSLK
jgi:spermidine synthase